MAINSLIQTKPASHWNSSRKIVTWWDSQVPNSNTLIKHFNEIKSDYSAHEPVGEVSHAWWLLLEQGSVSSTSDSAIYLIHPSHLVFTTKPRFQVLWSLSKFVKFFLNQLLAKGCWVSPSSSSSNGLQGHFSPGLPKLITSDVPPLGAVMVPCALDSSIFTAW